MEKLRFHTKRKHWKKAKNLEITFYLHQDVVYNCFVFLVESLEKVPIFPIDIVFVEVTKNKSEWIFDCQVSSCFFRCFLLTSDKIMLWTYKPHRQVFQTNCHVHRLKHDCPNVKFFWKSFCPKLKVRYRLWHVMFSAKCFFQNFSSIRLHQDI